MRPYLVVVRQLGGVGDVLSMTPVFRGLREKYPDHEIHWIAAEQYMGGALADIASHLEPGFVDRMHFIEPHAETTAHTKDVWGKWFGRADTIDDCYLLQNADMVFDLNNACVDYEWPAMSSPGGIRKPRYDIWCEAAGVTPSSMFPLYRVTEAEKAAAQQVFADRGWDDKVVIGVGLSACDKKRGLGRGQLFDICTRITEMGGHPVTIDATMQFITRDGDQLVEAIVGQRLRDVIPLIQCMNAVVSADSGILHMAGSVHTPVVGVFGPSDPEMRMHQYRGSATITRMPCAPCWYTWPCLKDIDPRKHLACLNAYNPAVIAEEAMRYGTGVL